MPVEMVGRQKDYREEQEVDRRSEDPEPRDDRGGSTVFGGIRDGRHATP
jgi:hypothetical protein